jgi:hypothetical protein
MPTEYYFGIGIAIIVVVLLGLLLKPGQGRRRIVQHQSAGPDQTAVQLSRIADSLEKLVVHLGASPRAEALPVPPPPIAEPLPTYQEKIDQPSATDQTSIEPPSAVEQTIIEPPSAADEKKKEQPVEHRVKLSMFGR